PLVLGAAPVDPLLEIDRLAERRIEGRITRRDPLHAEPGVTVTILARPASGPHLLGPQRLTMEHPQHSGFGSIFVLHRADLRAGEVVTRSLTVRCALTCSDGRCREKGEPNPQNTGHSTLICRLSVWVWPWSSVQLKRNSPVSVATVENAMNGFAAMAGN